jgi:syntaxin 1B/2/3
MAQQNYDGYGGSPYGNNQASGGYSAPANPYGSGDNYGAAANPYGGGGGVSHGMANARHEISNLHVLQYGAQPNARPALHEEDSTYSEQDARMTANVPHTDVPLQQAYQAPPVEQHGTQALKRDDFLERINGTRQRIDQLTADIASISNIHQRMLSSPDNHSSSELENIVTQTQIRNTQIKDEIKFLERDALRRQPDGASASFKDSQIRTIKNSFKTQLEAFQKEENDYGKRYREAIGRQYRIINPDATDAEVHEAQNADWGNEGVFSQAVSLYSERIGSYGYLLTYPQLKTNRSGQASSVLGAVRARHNDIQRIEKTMSELALLFTQLNEQVVYQEAQVTQIDEQTTQVHQDAEQANVHLDKGITSARRARKLKWWTLAVVVIILAILALALGIYFGAVRPKQNN